MANIRIKDLSTTAAVTASDDFIAVDGATNGTRKLDAYNPTFGGNLTVTGALLAHQTGTLNMAYEGSGLSQLVAYGADASTYGRANIILRKAGTGVGAVTALALTSTDATIAGNLTVSGGTVTATATGGSSNLITQLAAGNTGNSAQVQYINDAGTTFLTGVGGSLNGTTSVRGKWFWYSGGTVLGTMDASGNLGVTGNLTVSGGTISSGTATLTLKSTANTVVLQSAGTTALTLDSSQNATFAGKVAVSGAAANYALNAVGFVEAQGTTSSKGFRIYNTANGEAVNFQSNGITQTYDGTFDISSSNTTGLRIYGNAGSPLWRWVPWNGGSAGIVTNDSSGYINTSQSLPLLPITAPAAPASGWLLYTDSADSNKLKAKASTGTVVTLGTP